MNVDTLSGRDLDAMVAQHVFGLVIEPRTNSRTGEKDFVHEVHPGQWVLVSFYTASMAASISVEVALQGRGWKRKEWRGAWKSPNDVRVVLEHSDGRTVEAVGLLTEALCRAALKAVGSLPDPCAVRPSSTPSARRDADRGPGPLEAP